MMGMYEWKQDVQIDNAFMDSLTSFGLNIVSHCIFLL